MTPVPSSGALAAAGYMFPLIKGTELVAVLLLQRNLARASEAAKGASDRPAHARKPQEKWRFSAVEVRLEEVMDEEALLRIQSMIDKAVDSARGEIQAAEKRLAEGGRVQFRQLADLYRSTLEKVEHLEKHLGERIDATRGSIEALRSALERQDFRSDELGRRLTALETRHEQ